MKGGDSDTVVIDASTAHRVADGWTYGFPELAKDQRQKLLASNRISNPGCYPTGAIALLRPLIDAGLVRADSTPAVFGVSGYTGGGKELIAVHEQPGVEPFGLYGLELTHKHVPEMKKYSGLTHAPLFVPSVGHYAQGMLITVPITRDITTKQVTAKDVHQVLSDYYAGETFVPVRPLADRAWLERDRFLRADRLVDTNTMELAVYGKRCRRQRARRGLARQSWQGRVGRGGAVHQPQDRRRRDDGPRRRLKSLRHGRDASAAARGGGRCRRRADLTREAYAKWVPVIGREPMPMKADYEEAVRQHRIDLAFLDGGLAALIQTIDKGDHLVIENVAVAPAFQGRGLGRYLLAHAEQVARELGYAEVRLYTNKMFEANVRLYLGFGYRIDRQETSSLGVTVYMSKPLPAA